MVKYKNFEIKEDNGKLNFKNLKTGQEKNGIKIVYDREYVYKCQKTQIKSRHTAFEILEIFQKAIDEHFMTAMISAVCSCYIGECDYSF